MLDAEALYEAGRHASAIALGLYALEIELKVVICLRLDLDALPTVFQTHDHEALLVHTGLSNEIRRSKKLRHVSKNWDELLELPPVDQFRYGSNPDWDGAKASPVLHMLRNLPDGVIPWLRKQGRK